MIVCPFNPQQYRHCMMNDEEFLEKGLYQLIKGNPIYKYRPFSRGEEMLDKQEFYLSKPSDFNDPFDCYGGLICFDVSKKFLDQEIIEKLPNKSLLGSRIQRRRYEREVLKEKEKLCSEYFNSRRDRIGICCFSWDCENIVMWAHYADNHKGICLGFKYIEPIRKDIYGIYPVDYTSDIETYHFSSFDDEYYWRHWLCTKSNAWEYEKEARMIFKEYNGKVKFPKEILNDIYLGYSTSKEDEQRVRELLIEHDYPKTVKLYKMTIDNSKFILVPKEIKWCKSK